MTELFNKARDGDINAFTALFEPLRKKMHAVAYRLVGPDLAEDVVMDTYIYAWKALPGLRRDNALSAWLCRIARNRALDLIRKQKHTVSLDIKNEDGNSVERDIPDLDHSPADKTMRHDDLRILHYAMSQLSESHQTILKMRHIDELSYAEIAAATGISKGTVMSRLFHARKHIKSIFMEQTSLTSEPDSDTFRE